MNNVTMSLVVCIVSIISFGVQAAGARDEVPGLIFYASFDVGDLTIEPIDESQPGRSGVYPAAEVAGGSPIPKNVHRVTPEQAGRFGGAVSVPRNGLLSFEAAGNIVAQRGTIAFWVRVHQPLWSIPYRSGRFSNFVVVSDAQMPLRGEQLFYTRIHSRRKQIYLGDDNSPATWRPEEMQPDQWHHLAIAWDAAMGQRIYHNGELVADGFDGTMAHHAPFLDQISLGAWCMPAMNLLQHLGLSFDELYVFDYVLEDQQVRHLMLHNQPPAQRPAVTAEQQQARDAWVRAHFGLHEVGNPVAADAPEVLHVRAVYPDRLMDLGMHRTAAMNGRHHMRWPVVYKGYERSGQQLDLWFDQPRPFNQVRLRGTLVGRLGTGQQTVVLDDSDARVRRYHLDQAMAGEHVRIQRDHGSIEQIDLLHVSAGDPTRFGQSGPVFHLQPHDAQADDAGVALVQRHYPPEDRAAVVAGPAPTTRSRVSLKALRAVHVVTQPLEADTQIGTLDIKLHLAELREPATLLVQVHDPVTRTRLLGEFDVRLPAGRGASREQAVRIAFENAMLVEQGRQVWLTLWLDQDAELLCGPGLSRLTARPIDPQQRADYLVRTERFLCDLFLYGSEPQRWLGRWGAWPRAQYRIADEVMTVAEHLLHFDPGHYTAASIYSWVGRQRERWAAAEREAFVDPMAHVQASLPDNGAPRWAVLGREGLRVMQQHVHWWIDNRQIDNGEFGGSPNDDSDMIPDWVNFALISDPQHKIRRSYTLLADMLWDQWLREGWNIRMTDWLHAYEDGMNVQPQLLLLDYGNAEYVQRLMTTAKHYDGFYTAVTDAGRFVRSQRFGFTDGMDEDWPGLRGDTGNATLFKAGRYLAWYHGNPQVIQIMREWTDTWLNLAGPELQWPPYAIDYRTGQPIRERANHQQMTHQLNLLHEVTGQQRYAVHPPRRVQLEDPGDDARAELLAAVKQSVTHMKRYLPVHTWVGQSPDRVRIPQRPLAQMYLGGSASHAKRKGYHYHAVSWQGADEDVARFVVASGPDRLKVLLYSFHDEPQDVTMHVWRLDHGIYQVRAGVDRTGDEQIDQPVLDQTMTLNRYSPVPLRVPPREVFVVTVQQIEPLKDIRLRADLAVHPHWQHEQDSLVVSIHNQGFTASPATVVELVRDGQVIARQPLAAMPPAQAYEPAKMQVRFEQVGDPAGLVVRVDPDQQVSQITRANDQRRLLAEGRSAAQ